jgi:hypothetical protein
MKRFGFKVSSDRPYEIATTGSVQCTSWNTAASRAIKEHIKDLKEKGKNRKRNSKMSVSLWLECTSRSEKTEESKVETPQQET